MNAWMPLKMNISDANMMRPMIERDDRSSDSASMEFNRPMRPMVTGNIMRVYLTGLSCHMSMHTAGMKSATSVMYTQAFTNPTSTAW